MKRPIILLFLGILSLSACDNKNTLKEKKSTNDISHLVEFELRGFELDGVQYELKQWLKKTFKTNVEKIQKLKINDTLSLGIEVVLHEIKWRKNREFVFDTYYYRLDSNNKWRNLSNKPNPMSFYYDCKHIFSTSYIEGTNEYFRVDQSVKILPNN